MAEAICLKFHQSLAWDSVEKNKNNTNTHKAWSMSKLFLAIAYHAKLVCMSKIPSGQSISLSGVGVAHGEQDKCDPDSISETGVICGLNSLLVTVLLRPSFTRL